MQGIKTGSAELNIGLSHRACATKSASCAKGASCSRPDRNSVLKESTLSKSNPSRSQAQHETRHISIERRKPLPSQTFPAGHATLQASSTAAVIAARSPYSEATDSMSLVDDGFQCAAALKESLLQSLGQHAASLFWSQESTKVRQDICSDHIGNFACTY